MHVFRALSWAVFNSAGVLLILLDVWKSKDHSVKRHSPWRKQRFPYEKEVYLIVLNVHLYFKSEVHFKKKKKYK